LGGYPAGGGNRDIKKHTTILSGDLGVKDDKNDNAYHVVVITGNMGSALFDGFTIKNGNANETDIGVFVNGEYVNAGMGGGIINLNSDIGLNDLTIVENEAWVGAGIRNFGSNSIMSNLDIRGNTAGSNGGGINNNYAAPIIINSNISGNTSYVGGGITNIGYANLTLINVTLAGNKGTEGRGAIENVDLSKITIYNSIITHNSSGIYNDPGIPGHSEPSISQASYSLIQDSQADSALHMLDGATDPKFISPVDFQMAPTLQGDLRLQPASAAIDKGNSALYAPSQTPDISKFITDLAGNPRIFGTAIDMGAYELDVVNSEALCIESDVQLTSGIQGNGFSYQWEVDEGSGYVVVTDGTFYTGTTTNMLTIKNIPGNWYGQTYRCAINGGQQYGRVYAIKFRNEWLGPADGSWHNAAHWSCGRVPDEFTDVVISRGSVVISANTVVRSLFLEPGVQISLVGQSTLTVTQ
ncbi:MAG TPA: choice-of-anchor Q domain-containing protein, partial [Phnomibacter sp.]|nr:choice-of-anchor Q domain-containing protein [Phnomibacter sp.]